MVTWRRSWQASERGEIKYCPDSAKINARRKLESCLNGESGFFLRPARFLWLNRRSGALQHLGITRLIGGIASATFLRYYFYGNEGRGASSPSALASSRIPRRGSARFLWMSALSAFSGETYNTRTSSSNGCSSPSLNRWSMAVRNAASVLPEPVGAAMSGGGGLTLHSYFTTLGPIARGT